VAFGIRSWSVGAEQFGPHAYALRLASIQIAIFSILCIVDVNERKPLGVSLRACAPIAFDW